MAQLAAKRGRLRQARMPAGAGEAVGSQSALPRRQRAGTKAQHRKPLTAYHLLTRAQVRALVNAPAGGIVGERDRLLLALLVGAGLRLQELVELRFEDVKMAGRRTVLVIRRGLGWLRLVPVSDTLAAMLESWGRRIGRTGPILNPLATIEAASLAEPTKAQYCHMLSLLREAGRGAERMTPEAVTAVVRRYGAMIGVPDLLPRDLRRTYAQIGLDAGVPIQHISKSLGHHSVAVTQRYLRLNPYRKTVISDFVPLEPLGKSALATQ